jgi:allantoicase
MPELSSVALGGRIVAVSDEFFAEAYHLLEVGVRPFIIDDLGCQMLIHHASLLHL